MTVIVEGSSSDLEISIKFKLGATEKVVAIASESGPNAPLEPGVSTAIVTA